MFRAIAKRRDEFTAGRDAARAAMDALGLPPMAISQDTDRAPVWPDGLTGSIAHCDHICIAAVARIKHCAGLGIDIEPATPLDADLVSTICTLAEREWLATQSDPGLSAKMIFCAKEATYKAQYMQTRTLIDFQVVEVNFSHDKGLFKAKLDQDLTGIATPVSGGLRLVDDYILATCRL